MLAQVCWVCGCGGWWHIFSGSVGRSVARRWVGQPPPTILGSLRNSLPGGCKGMAVILEVGTARVRRACGGSVRTGPGGGKRLTGSQHQPPSMNCRRLAVDCRHPPSDQGRATSTRRWFCRLTAGLTTPSKKKTQKTLAHRTQFSTSFSKTLPPPPLGHLYGWHVSGQPNGADRLSECFAGGLQEIVEVVVEVCNV